MSTHAQVAPSALSISSISVRQDDQGRYCLNDLHKASGNNPKHKPDNFLRLDTTKELCAEIEQFSDLRTENGEAGIPALKTIKGGKASGTFVVKELVYAYAMWISASFSLKVIRAYDALVTHKMEAELKQAQIPKPKPAKTKSILHARIEKINIVASIVSGSLSWSISIPLDAYDQQHFRAGDMIEVVLAAGDDLMKAVPLGIKRRSAA